MNKTAENKDKRTSGLAIASLVLGIFAVILGWVPIFGWIFIILTLTFGIKALGKIKEGPRSGRGLAISGIVLGSIGLILAILPLIGYISFVGKGTTCKDLNCFVSYANKCTKATFKETNDFGTIRYLITSDDDKCILTKEIVELSKNEDPLIKKIIEGKKMECEYAPGNFNNLWVESMILGAEDCDGELKEAIGHLLLLL